MQILAIILICNVVFQVRLLSTILVIIFWNFTMSQYRSKSPKVKRNLVSSIASLVYELPHELPNDLRILGNQKILEKSQILVETQPSVLFLFQTLNLGKSSQKTRKNRYQIFPFQSNFTGFSYLCQIFCPGLQVSIKKKMPKIIKWRRGEWLGPEPLPPRLLRHQYARASLRTRPRLL